MCSVQIKNFTLKCRVILGFLEIYQLEAYFNTVGKFLNIFVPKYKTDFCEASSYIIIVFKIS